MTLINYVPEKGRAYVRLFDHEEAVRRYHDGERVANLAAEYGVSTAGIYRILNSRNRQARLEAQRRWRTGTCEECGGPAMRLVGGKALHNKDGRCLCLSCRGKARRTRFVEIQGELHARCVICHDVKPLDNFPGGMRFKDIRPNGIHDTCRACHTEIKRRYRRAHPDYNARQNAARVRKYHERRRNGDAVQTTASAE